MQTLVKFLLARLAGITAQQWASALQWVIYAAREMRDAKGYEKRIKVVETLSSSWPTLSGWAGNLLVELALAVARREGKA